MGSDHEITQWEVDMEMQKEARHLHVIGWNLAAMLPEDKEHVEILWKKQAMGRGYCGVESTGGDDESKAEWCLEALGKVLDATAKTIRSCTQSKGWWDGEMKERRSQLGRKKKMRRRTAVTAQAKGRLQK
jgi:hypothetical protein